MERKSVALQIKSADDQTGTFTGLASVFDNVDYDATSSAEAHSASHRVAARRSP